MDNLPLLRDIHLPPESFGFPLGYGWGIFLLGIVLVFLSLFVVRKVHQKSKKIYALMLLNKAFDNDLKSAKNVSEVLRRICLYKYQEAATLFGREWISFLNAHSKSQISGEAADLLIYAPYLPENKAPKKESYEKLRLFARQWIGENL